ncbi:MAG: pilus assembly protein PilM [Planctomycetota bacterium]|nr:pilus assembly protein PilM [Planctomycetota bacterium]
MPLKITKGRSLPIGLDPGTSAVKAAQFRFADGELELLAAGSAPIPRPCRDNFDKRLEAIADGLRGILKANDFKGRQCALSLPACQSFVHHVRIPKLPPEQINLAVQRELQGKLPYPIRDAMIRHVIVGDIYGEAEPKQEVIVVAAARKTLGAYLAMTRRVGLNVVTIDVEPCAVVECFQRLFRRATDAQRPILYIDMGAASTQVVLSHGPQIVFARNLAKGGEQLDQAVAKGMQISLEQACATRIDLLRADSQTGQAGHELYRFLDSPLSDIAEELNQCLRYHDSVFRNQSVERVIFVGGQAYDRRLCQTLAQQLNLPAQIGDPLVRVKRVEGAGLAIGLDRREPQPDWAVAVGLSLGASQAA